MNVNNMNNFDLKRASVLINKDLLSEASKNINNNINNVNNNFAQTKFEKKIVSHNRYPSAMSNFQNFSGVGVTPPSNKVNNISKLNNGSSSNKKSSSEKKEDNNPQVLTTVPELKTSKFNTTNNLTEINEMLQEMDGNKNEVTKH